VVERLLTDKQVAFAREYIIDYNATQAAKRSGYSEKTAYAQGSKLLKKAEIKEALAKNLKEQEELLRQRFSTDAIEARKIMFNIMKDNDSPPAVRLSAAKDFLDRAGFKPTDKQELSGGFNVNNPYEGLTTEELKKIARSDK